MKNSKGITLIALVVTIVVLLILASISISVLTGDNGIINNSKEAKEDTEIAEEKETVELSAVQAAGKDEDGNVIEENLREQLDINIGEGKYNLEIEGDKFKVTYTETNRSYYVDKDGNIEIAGIDSPDDDKDDTDEEPEQPPAEETYNLTITYSYAPGEEGNVSSLPATYTASGLPVGHNFSVVTPEIIGYVARPSIVEGTISDSDVNMSVIYYIDNNGNGIPDSQEEYKLTIYYGFAPGQAGSVTLPATYTASGLPVGHNFLVATPEISGYVARPSIVEGIIYNSNITQTVYYYIDKNGNGVPDDEEY